MATDDAKPTPPDRTEDEEPDRELAVEIKGLMYDPSSSLPIIILREEESQRLLPIWIGFPEANAIAFWLDGRRLSRPLTHDLLLQGLNTLGAEVEKIVICDLRESTFFALIHLRRGDESLTLDARPSDALALALRAEAPIFVTHAVLQKAQAADRTTDTSDEEQLKKWLEEISPEDLGEYTM